MIKSAGFEFKKFKLALKSAGFEFKKFKLTLNFSYYKYSSYMLKHRFNFVNQSPNLVSVVHYNYRSSQFSNFSDKCTECKIFLSYSPHILPSLWTRKRCKQLCVISLIMG